MVTGEVARRRTSKILLHLARVSRIEEMLRKYPWTYPYWAPLAVDLRFIIHIIHITVLLQERNESESRNRRPFLVSGWFSLFLHTCFSLLRKFQCTHARIFCRQSIHRPYHLGRSAKGLAEVVRAEGIGVIGESVRFTLNLKMKGKKSLHLKPKLKKASGVLGNRPKVSTTKKNQRIHFIWHQQCPTNPWTLMGRDENVNWGWPWIENVLAHLV
jgi:hypothetical protein